uniref:Uncharacterized protein n=1 Tax=Tanacetum cinerariifolium TaxID=118510 RepID=A0A699I8W9_TANCI|nr:hypothetical protein [Tanacetum cinerariifolium]
MKSSWPLRMATNKLCEEKAKRCNPPPSPLATLAVLEEEINKRCKLNLGPCKLKYFDEDEEWSLMTSDAYMQGR